jgi:cytochrome P450
LTRLEARIALSKLIDRFPEMRLDPQERLTFCHNVRESALFGPEKLPVLLNGA